MDDYRNKGQKGNLENPAFQMETSEKSTIEKLVVQAVDGSADAFGELYSLFFEKIYRYIFYQIYNKAASEDITGDVFLKAWRAIGSCRGKENTFSSWLYRIAHNQLIDEIRKRQRRPSVELEDAEHIGDPGSDAEGYSRQQELLRKIESLSSNHKQVIILKFIDGMDTREIAEIMGKREGAIRALQMRALATLKKNLDKE